MSTQVRPATKTVKLYVGGDWDLVDEYQRLQAEAQNPTSLAGSDRTRLEKIEATFAADMMAFKFQSLGRRRMQKLIDEHPPRPNKKRDEFLGFNEDAATDALIRKCLVEPDLSEADLTELLEEQLSDGQYQTLAEAVFAINRRTADVPLSLPGSTNHRSTGDE